VASYKQLAIFGRGATKTAGSGADRPRPRAPALHGHWLWGTVTSVGRHERYFDAQNGKTVALDISPFSRGSQHPFPTGLQVWSVQV